MCLLAITQHCTHNRFRRVRKISYTRCYYCSKRVYIIIIKSIRCVRVIAVKRQTFFIKKKNLLLNTFFTYTVKYRKDKKKKLKNKQPKPISRIVSDGVHNTYVYTAAHIISTGQQSSVVVWMCIISFDHGHPTIGWRKDIRCTYYTYTHAEGRLCLVIGHNAQ